MLILNLNIDAVSYNRDSRCFATEVSSIKHLVPPGYDGKNVKVIQGNKSIEFSFFEEKSDGEGEVYAWDYIAIKGHKFCVKLTIYND